MTDVAGVRVPGERVVNPSWRRHALDLRTATRRAIEVRDRVCGNEFCEVPAEECEIDHVQPYAAGGLTTTENGKPACSYHNRWKQRRGPPAA